MFLRSILRKKNGKEHESFSIVENRRVAGGKVVQRHVLYLGEINSTQQEAWRRTIEIFEDGQLKPKTVALFPEDRAAAINSDEIVRIRLKDLQLRRLLPRQGGCDLTSRRTSTPPCPRTKVSSPRQRRPERRQSLSPVPRR